MEVLDREQHCNSNVSVSSDFYLMLVSGVGYHGVHLTRAGFLKRTWSQSTACVHSVYICV